MLNTSLAPDIVFSDGPPSQLMRLQTNMKASIQYHKRLITRALDCCREDALVENPSSEHWRSVPFSLNSEYSYIFPRNSLPVYFQLVFHAWIPSLLTISLTDADLL